MQHARIEHVLPGRVRLKFPAQRGNVPFFEQLVTLVSQHPSVDEALANPRTGSLLVRHSGTLEELTDAAVQMGLISPAALAELKRRGLSPNANWKTLLKRAPANLPLLTFTGLSAVAALRGRVAGPASEQFWHAFVMWQRKMPQVALGLALLGLLQVSRGKVFGSASSLLVYGLIMQDAVSGQTPVAAEADLPVGE